VTVSPASCMPFQARDGGHGPNGFEAEPLSAGCLRVTLPGDSDVVLLVTVLVEGIGDDDNRYE
jgi:hypothetical protein